MEGLWHQKLPKNSQNTFFGLNNPNTLLLTHFYRVNFEHPRAFHRKVAKSNKSLPYAVFDMMNTVAAIYGGGAGGSGGIGVSPGIPIPPGVEEPQAPPHQAQKQLNRIDTHVFAMLLQS